MQKNIALVVPSIRQNCFDDFVERWNLEGLFDEVDLVLVEDNPCQTFDLVRWSKMGVQAHHFSWAEIDEQLGDRAWVIPRRSDTVRSFGYWWAWKQDYEYTLTLDDDCYPDDGPTLGLVKGHLSALNERSRWFNTLNSGKPRGIPYKNVGTQQVHVNHGLWTNVLDYDAPTQLVAPFPEEFSHDNRVVPAGMYFPFCGMNACFRKQTCILMYHLLMGQLWNRDLKSLTKLPCDRFGDIWCGIIMKKIADHLGWLVSTGTPYIKHERASNPFTNLKKEANGIEVNERFWELVDDVTLTAQSPESCYIQLAGGLAQSLPVAYPEHTLYWNSMTEAMRVWAGLFV